MANDWVKAPLAEPQAVLPGREIVDGDFDDLPGNLNASLAEPVLQIMDLRVPDTETPIATLVGAGIGTWTDLQSGDLRIPSPSPDAALFDVKVILRVGVVGLAGLARVNLASGPTAGAALPIMGAADVEITVGPVAAPYDDLMVQIRGAAGCTIEVFGLAIEYVPLADPIVAGTDFGDDSVALDVGVIADDEPLDAALLAALKANLEHIYQRPRPAYFRVGFNSALSGQEALEAPYEAENGAMYVTRSWMLPSVGAAEDVQVWVLLRNSDAAAKSPRIYYGPAARWPNLNVEVEIAGLTTAYKLFEVPARDGRDIESMTWPMTELGFRSFEDVEVLAVAAWAA